MSSWRPDVYQRFKDERARPFHDLLALVRPVPGGRVVDLGCGTGELTQLLHRTTGAADTVGLDSSETMLSGSAAFAGDGLRFVRQGIEEFAAAEGGGRYDLVFSNAALHWVPDHPHLLRALTALVRDGGGQLAFQVPSNHDHPAHETARAVAADFGGLASSPVLPPDAYARILHDLGFPELRARLEVYCHLLESRDKVVDWLMGTTLTPIRERLDDAAWASYLQRFREALLPQLEDTRPYFYTFKRVLVWASRL